MANDDIIEGQTTETSSDDSQHTVVIPEDFLVVYGKLLLLMIELGESMLHDCKSLCSARNMPIVECYHMFKAALGANQLADISVGSEKKYYKKLSNTLLNYVSNQLDCITENYKDTISFTVPIDANALITWLSPLNGTDLDVIVDPSDSSGKHKVALSGNVVTVRNTPDYGITDSDIEAHNHWQVFTGYEFVPNTTAVYINGVRYWLDEDDYREWIVTKEGVQTGVGIILNEGFFDVAPNADEIYVEAILVEDLEDVIK